jgi:hypothetical protein
MALNIFDPRDDSTSDLASTGAASVPLQNESFSIGKLFSDPNFVNLLADIGAKLDPQGVGGALGTATQHYVSAPAAQKTGAKVPVQNEKLLNRST